MFIVLRKSFAAVFLIGSAVATSAQAPLQPRHPFSGVCAPRPALRAILEEQVSAASITHQQKPTGIQRLIAAVLTATFDGSTYYLDSTAYVYSGSRASKLSSLQWSYSDTYEPFYHLVVPYIHYFGQPTLQYDTARYFRLLGATGYYSIGWRQRIYGPSNRLASSTSVNLDETGAATSRAYRTFAYEGDANMVQGQEFRDTSADATSQYLAQQINASYSGDQRTKDTFRYHALPTIYTTAARYTYNSAGNLDTVLMQEYNPGTGLWANGSRDVNTYDSEGRLVTSSSQWWGSTTGWVVQELDTFGYTGAAPMYTFWEYRSFNDGVANGYRHTAVLNSFGAWDTVEIYQVDSSGSAALLTRSHLLYNADQHITHTYSADYDLQTGDTVFYLLRYQYEIKPSAVTGPAQATAFAALAPNPAQDRTIVAIARPQGRIHLAVSNLAGQVVYEQSSPAASAVEVNTSALPAGLYIIVVRMEGDTQTLRFVKE